MSNRAIAIYNSKGGQGKSILTLVLATWAGLKGLNVGAVDGDDGRTVWDWGMSRQQSGKSIPFEISLVAGFNFAQRTIGGRSYEWIFVDFPPAFNDKIEQALGYCDLLILPIKIGEAELNRLQRLFENRVIRDIPKIFVLNQILWFETRWLNPTRRKIEDLIKEYSPGSPIVEIKYRSEYGKFMQGTSFWDGRKPQLYKGPLWDELRRLFQGVGLPLN